MDGGKDGPVSNCECDRERKGLQNNRFKDNMAVVRLKRDVKPFTVSCYSSLFS